MKSNSTGIIIRQAQPSDAEQLIAFVQRLTEEPRINIVLGPGEFILTVEEERKFVADYAASDNSLLLVAEADGRVVGALTCAGGRRQAVRHAATLGMSVAKEWRNRGVGSALLARAVEWARNNPVVSRVELFVFVRNEAAIHLYRKFGFEVEGRRRKAVCRDGEHLDDLIMSLLL